MQRGSRLSSERARDLRCPQAFLIAICFAASTLPVRRSPHPERRLAPYRDCRRRACPGSAPPASSARPCRCPAPASARRPATAARSASQQRDTLAGLGQLLRQHLDEVEIAVGEVLDDKLSARHAARPLAASARPATPRPLPAGDAASSARPCSRPATCGSAAELPRCGWRTAPRPRSAFRSHAAPWRQLAARRQTPRACPAAPSRSCAAGWSRSVRCCAHACRRRRSGRIRGCRSAAASRARLAGILRTPMVRASSGVAKRISTGRSSAMISLASRSAACSCFAVTASVARSMVQLSSPMWNETVAKSYSFSKAADKNMLARVLLHVIAATLGVDGSAARWFRASAKQSRLPGSAPPRRSARSPQPRSRADARDSSPSGTSIQPVSKIWPPLVG